LVVVVGNHAERFAMLDFFAFTAGGKAFALVVLFGSISFAIFYL
jgi:hypothetical protein